MLKTLTKIAYDVCSIQDLLQGKLKLYRKRISSQQ